MNTVISISNQKGGVGKTTTAINLSASLSIADQKILLIDMDPQGNATSGLGVIAGKHDIDAYGLLLNDLPYFEGKIKKTELDNFDIIPSDIDLIGAEIELIDKPGREFRLKKFIDGVRDKYNFIILDTPPSLGLLTLNALTAADTILIPLQCEYYALEGLAQLLKTVELVKKDLNKLLSLQGILLTMFDSRTTLSLQVANEVKMHFGDKVLNTIIPRNVRLGEAPSHGKPIMLYDCNSKGANAYIDLAKEIIGRCKEKH